MKYQMLSAGLILLMLFLIPVSAFEVREGGSVVISTPIHDDLLITGDTVTINAPVKSVTFAGGTLIVNSPVEENLIAAGGEVQVNAPVGTDVIAAGGRITINEEVGGKILAVGGQVAMNGKSPNVALYGDRVTLGNASHISGDALISSSGYEAGGQVDGNLQAEGHNGGFTSHFNFEKVGEIISACIMMMQILCAIGMLILGVILIRLMPGPCNAVISSVREKTLMSGIFGISGVIIAFILTLILILTLVGIPIAIFIVLITFVGLMVAPIFTGAALGTIISEKTGKEFSVTISFVIGFIILQILFLVPIIGFILEIIAICIGFGALLQATWERIETQS